MQLPLFLPGHTTDHPLSPPKNQKRGFPPPPLRRLPPPPARPPAGRRRRGGRRLSTVTRAVPRSRDCGAHPLEAPPTDAPRGRPASTSPPSSPGAGPCWGGGPRGGARRRGKGGEVPTGFGVWRRKIKIIKERGGFKSGPQGAKEPGGKGPAV